MSNNYISISSMAHEHEENLSNAFRLLWDSILDTNDGIDEFSYHRLCQLGNLIDPKFVGDVSRFVDATDGRFYISNRGNDL